jgi:hypothetical protein
LPRQRINQLLGFTTNIESSARHFLAESKPQPGSLQSTLALEKAWNQSGDRAYSDQLNVFVLAKWMLACSNLDKATSLVAVLSTLIRILLGLSILHAMDERVDGEPCPICGSTRWLRSGYGVKTCENGHEVEDYAGHREMHVEERSGRQEDNQIPALSSSGRQEFQATRAWYF